MLLEKQLIAEWQKEIQDEFFYAIEEGNLNKVKILVSKHKFLVNEENDSIFRNTYPLIFAIKKDKYNIAEFLLQKGADPNKKDCLYPPIFHAVSDEGLNKWYKNICYLDLLIEYGAKTEVLKSKDNDALRTSIVRNNSDLVKYCVEKLDFDPRNKINYGYQYKKEGTYLEFAERLFFVDQEILDYLKGKILEFNKLDEEECLKSSATTQENSLSSSASTAASTSKDSRKDDMKRDFPDYDLADSDVEEYGFVVIGK